MTDKEAFAYRRAVFLFLTIGFFVLSGYFSIESFTGYIISEDVDAVANWTALLFFVLGLIGAYLLLWKRK